MRCGSCGEEVDPDLTFCHACGASVGISRQPSAEIPLPHPIPSSVAPPLSFSHPDGIPQHSDRKITKMPEITPQILLKGVLISIAVIAIAIQIIIYAVSIPVGIGTLTPPSQVPTVNVTPVPTTVTPTPTTKPIPVPTTIPTPTPARMVNPRSGITYEQIYSSDRSYMYGMKEIGNFPLEYPPLYVMYNITPVMVNQTRPIGNESGTEIKEDSVYPDPDAWFEIRMIDSASSQFVERNGYGLTYGYPPLTSRDFMVRTKGNYRLIISGNKVNASVTVWTPVP